MTPGMIQAPAERVFEGRAVGAGGKASCSGCRRTVREGDPVGVYVYRTSDATLWDITRLSCAECRQASIPHPTVGASELVLHARLAVTSDAATQRSRLTLRDPDTIAHSPPSEGAEP